MPDSVWGASDIGCKRIYQQPRTTDKMPVYSVQNTTARGPAGEFHRAFQGPKQRGFINEQR